MDKIISLQNSVYKILLVDDRLENLITLENLVDGPGRHITKATSGNEALKIAITQHLDLILMDVQMPGMDGMETAGLLRMNPKTKHIPIVFVSAVSRGEKQSVAGFEPGTIDFLYKPLDINETRQKVSLYEQLYMLQNESRETYQRAEQIEKEFDRFVYIVSHDIKAPLRAIDNLVNWIEDDLGTNKTPGISENLLLLQNRVQRVQKLLDGITEYSRVSRMKEPKEHIQLGPLVHSVVDSITVPPSAVINIKEGAPAIFAERNKLIKIFTNLINNAIIHQGGGSVIVDVDYIEFENIIQFSIRDNGVGINKQYHEKVFEIFHTLLPKDKLDTCGVGLTIVKRLVEAEGQRIWFDDLVTTGTCINFTWSKK